MERLRRLVHEIHRRSLWQVLGIYAVAAWVAFEVVQTLTEGLGLPDWFPAFAFALLVLGLPIVLATAFVQEGLRPAGGEEERDPRPGAGRQDTLTGAPEPRGGAPAARPAGPGARDGGDEEGVRRLLTWRNALLGGMAAFALWGVVAAGWLLLGGGPEGGPVGGAAGEIEAPGAAGAPAVVEKSIAVLPFEDLSPEGDQRYFVEGLSEEIINALSRIPELRVAARTSTFLLAEEGADIATVAGTLGVANVLEGSVRKAGDRVRITAQLIEAGSGFHLWSESFDRRLTDIFAIQDAIARAIADRLEVTLAGETAAELVGEATESDEAYDTYLRGRYFWNQRTAESLHRAIEHFERAIELDPGYAEAHAGLADALILLPAYEPVEDRSSIVRDARAAAERALELDPGLAEAHTSLAYVHTYDRAWEEAERGFRRAIEVNPDYATAHQWYSNLLAWSGRTAEGVDRGRRAVELDPLSRIKNRDLVMALHFDRRFAEAARWARKTIELDPDWPLIWFDLSIAEIERGRFEEAEDAWMRYTRLVGSDTAAARQTIEAMVRFNRTGEPQPLPADIEERLGVPEFVYTLIYPEAGQWERGLREIEESLDEGGGVVPYLLLSSWDPVRDDPRVRRLLEEAGLPR